MNEGLSWPHVCRFEVGEVDVDGGLYKGTEEVGLPLGLLLQHKQLGML